MLRIDPLRYTFFIQNTPRAYWPLTGPKGGGAMRDAISLGPRAWSWRLDLARRYSTLACLDLPRIPMLRWDMQAG